MKYVIAVSGGIDSVVLLDMMSKVAGDELIVAHFDHGIRPDSRLDEAFVRSLAHKYGAVYEMAREDLGIGASEALARDRRYAFLKGISAKHNAPLVTAHHLDDLVETVAINIHRGTGWRGLAALDSTVYRPIVDIEKRRLKQYAAEQGLVWREDSTNASDKYLRNRIRPRTQTLDSETKRHIRAHQLRQKELRQEIEKEARALIGDGPEYDRHFFTHVSSEVALECIRSATEGALTRPQAARLLHAIKTALPGSHYEAGSGVLVHFTSRKFSL